MIILVNGNEQTNQSYLTTEMFRIRAKVFHERLGWDVKVNNGMERDGFDDANPLYLVSVDDVTGKVRGSLRLLPTTGPNMLRDVFPSLLPDGETVESATIWESSRFSMEPGAETPEPGRLLSSVTGELLAAIEEVGLLAGLTYVVSVFDARMVRIFRSAGCPALIIGKPQRIGVCMTYAGLFEISEQARDKIRQACGITGSVLEPQSTRRLFAA